MPSPSHAAERFRRFLLGAAAALIAARPLVTGDDPGRAVPGTTGTLWITFGWFALLAGTCIWHAWAVPGRRITGWVALGLIATALLVAARAAAGAPPDMFITRPPLIAPWIAWRTAWEWAALPAAFIAVRMLTADRGDGGALYTVVLATGVAEFVVWHSVALANWFGLDWTAVNSTRSVDTFLGWLLFAAIGSLLLTTSSALERRKLIVVLIVALALVVTSVLIRSFEGKVGPPFGPGLAMVADQPGMGVGPGHYSRVALRYYPLQATSVDVQSPSHFLTVAATCGLPVLAALLATYLLFFWESRSVWRSQEPIAASPLGSAALWPCYLGGAVGLFLGLLAQVGDLSAGNSSPIRQLGVAAAWRGLVWFGSFSVIERWVSRANNRAIALVVTVAFVAISATFLDLLSAPDLAQPFFVLAALALNAVAPSPESAWTKSVPGRIVPLLVAVALLLGFTLHILAPAVASASSLRLAKLGIPGAEAKRRKISAAADKLSARVEARRVIHTAIMKPLREAVQANPRDPQPFLEQVPWWLALWELSEPQGADVNAIKAAQLAQALDPENTAGLRAEFGVRLRFAELTAAKRPEQFEHAETLIREIVKRDPSAEARLRCQVAKAHFAAKDAKAGFADAIAAQKLDVSAPGPRYKLTDEEREQIRQWLAAGP